MNEVKRPEAGITRNAERRSESGLPFQNWPRGGEKQFFFACFCDVLFLFFLVKSLLRNIVLNVTPGVGLEVGG